MYTYEQVKKAYSSKGYVFFGEKQFDLNIFGVRSPNRNQAIDSFDDKLGCAYIDLNGKPAVKIWKATTDPGLTHMQRPTFQAAIERGTAILCEGQYRAAYRVGYHGSGNWRHRALIQVGPVRIYRDKNRDTILDVDGVPITKGNFGINIHAASLWRAEGKIGLYSAGCQVIQEPKDYFDLMDLCKRQESMGLGSSFTYTLFLESEIA